MKIGLVGPPSFRFDIGMRDDESAIQTREAFMAFFRDDACLDLLTPDDRIEIFETILLGSSDITKARLDGLLEDYCVSRLRVVEVLEAGEGH